MSFDEIGETRDPIRYATHFCPFLSWRNPFRCHMQDLPCNYDAALVDPSEMALLISNGPLFILCWPRAWSVQDVLVQIMAGFGFEVDDSQRLPAICQVEGVVVLLVGRQGEDVGASHRLKLEDVAEEEDEDSSEGDSSPLLDFLQLEIKLVEHVRFDHGVLISNDNLKVLQGDLGLVSFFVAQ